MTINLTPEVQMEIYRDKQKQYTIEMLDKLNKKVEYEPKDKEEDDKKGFVTNENDKNKPWISDSTYGSKSYYTQKNLNSNFSTESFFNTLGSTGGNVSNNSKSTSYSAA